MGKFQFLITCVPVFLNTYISSSFVFIRGYKLFLHALHSKYHARNHLRISRRVRTSPYAHRLSPSAHHLSLPENRIGAPEHKRQNIKQTRLPRTGSLFSAQKCINSQNTLFKNDKMNPISNWENLPLRSDIAGGLNE